MLLCSGLNFNLHPSLSFNYRCLMIKDVLKLFFDIDLDNKEEVSFTKKELSRFLLWSVIITVVTLIIGMPFIAIIFAGLILIIIYEML